VGNADGKNPPGQFKDGSDHNHGYECDKNHGIGRTNPAHSGCQPGSSTTSSTVFCEVEHHGNGHGNGRKDDDDCSTTTTEATTTTTEASTTTTVGGTTSSTVATNVLGEGFQRPSAQAASSQVSQPLARTGSSVRTELFWAGLALALGGLAAMFGELR